MSSARQNTTPDWAGVLRLLTDLGDTAGVDVQDEHVRWRLYREHLEAGRDLGAIVRALRIEPDAVVVVATISLALDLHPLQDPFQWLEIAPTDGDRAQVARRICEHAVRAALTSPLSETTVASWSNWLQLRLAAEATESDVLSALAQLGRTKRIRRIATERGGA